MLSRATSMLPPVVLESLFRWRGKVASCRPWFQERPREAQPQCQVGEAAGNGVGGWRLHRGEPSAEHQALERAVEFALNGIAAVVEQVVMQIDPHRTNVRAGAAKRAGVGQVRPLLRGTQMRRDDGNDGPLIGGAIRVAADILVNRAGVETRAATDAMQGIALLGIGEQTRANVVEENDVKFPRAVGL